MNIITYLHTFTYIDLNINKYIYIYKHIYKVYTKI